MRFLLIAILVYLAYQFIFNFLVPVFITARRIRKGFREMSAGMNHFAGNSHADTHQPSGKTNDKAGKDDYIDFEEVK